jgi:hypothetical protein
VTGGTNQMRQTTNNSNLNALALPISSHCRSTLSSFWLALAYSNVCIIPVDNKTFISISVQHCYKGRLISDTPELNAALDYEGLATYIDLIHLLKPDLSHFGNSNGRDLPECLPRGA